MGHHGRPAVAAGVNIRRYMGDRKITEPVGPYNARYTGDHRSFFGPVCGDDYPVYHAICEGLHWPITNCSLASVAITCRPLSGNESPIGSTDPASASGGPSRPWPAGPGAGRSRDPRCCSPARVRYRTPGRVGRGGELAGAAGPCVVTGPGRRGGIPGLPGPGPGPGRPRGRTVPGRIDRHRRDGESRPLRSVTFMGRCPGRA